MPWKECSKMDGKLRFVARHLDGESILLSVPEFGISRVTGLDSCRVEPGDNPFGPVEC